MATPTRKPRITRRNEMMTLRVRARSNQSDWNDCTTSTGLGRMVGEMIRSSAGPLPVSTHQIRTTPRIGTTPRT